MRPNASAALLIIPALALAGCGTSFSPTASAPPISPAATFRGNVHGGQQPVAGAVVTLWAAGSSGYGTGASVLATAIAPTDASGNFAFGAITCPSAATSTYITAQGGDAGFTTNTAIMLAAGLGPCSGLATLSVNINEVTTAATAYALSHFFTTTLGTSSSDGFGGAATQAEVANAGLVQANTSTIPTLVTLASGAATPSTATLTTESAKLYTLANILAACVNSSGVSGPSDTTSACAQLFAATTPPGATTAPSDTLQAAVQMALYPYQNVAALTALPPAASPFVGLSATPNDLTLAVAYTAPALGLAINGTAISGTSSNLDIDASGRVWFPTSSASAHGLAVFDPSSNSFAGPYATALVHPQYLAVDIDGIVWGTDLAGNRLIGANAANPASLTSYTSANGSTTGPVGITSNNNTPNAVMYTVTNAVGVSSVFQENNGTQNKVSNLFAPPTGLAPYALRSPNRYFEAEVATSGFSSACQLEAPYISSGNTSDVIIAVSGLPCESGGVAQFSQQSEESVMSASTLNQLCSYLAQQCFAPPVAVSAPQGLAVDGDGNLWVANAGDGSVSTLSYARVTNTTDDYGLLSPIPYQHGTGQGDTLTQPYGIAIDRSGNVWLSNAGCVATNGTACTPAPFMLTEIIGAAAPTITPLALQTTTFSNGARPSAAAPSLRSQQATRHPGASI